MGDDKDMRLTNRERTNMNVRSDVLGEINDVLDNEIMTAEQLLGELLGAMTTDELNENWDYIKKNWALSGWFPVGD